MKIENAIILAAGRGSRMGRLTDNKPKCMMKIGNETVIQRLIYALKYKNINNIIVITGYKSDVLRKHIHKIDKHIQVKENSIWHLSNSITSICHAIDYLKNAVVIDSDIYIHNFDCIRNDVEYSGYSAIKTSKPAEWQLLVDEDGFIQKTEKSGSYDNGLPIIDISYWLEKDANIVASHLVNFMQHGSIEDGYKFWDEIPLIDFLSQFKLKRYDISDKDAMEFDTPAELKCVRNKVCLVDLAQDFFGH